MTTVSSDEIQHPTQDKITAEFINDCFILGALTGTVYWRERPASHFATSGARAVFNSVFAGRPVGHFDNLHGYRVLRITVHGKRRQLFLHRVVWVLAKGAWPVNQLDHRDVDPGHNDVANLREATRAQNRQNTRARKGSTTGLKGVSVHRNGFTSYIHSNNHSTYLGKFKDPLLAHEAYKTAALAKNGEFARWA